MIPFLADIDLAFKLLAPRPADWPTILPELAVAGLALLCLLELQKRIKQLSKLNHLQFLTHTKARYFEI